MTADKILPTCIVMAVRWANRHNIQRKAIGSWSPECMNTTVMLTGTACYSIQVPVLHSKALDFHDVTEASAVMLSQL